MIINHNLSAINSHRALKFNELAVDKTMKALSSGMRINSAADDASGLAVSEKLRTQVNGLRQAERNTEDGMSFIQTAEGFLEQTSNIIQRIRVLAIQTSNGIYSNEDRQLVQVEVSALVDEVDRIASQAEFNKFKLFEGQFARGSRVASMWFHMGPNQNQRERFYIGTMTSKALKLVKADGRPIAISSPGEANDVIGVADAALTKIMKQRADMGAYYNRLEYTAKGLMGAYENMQASESRIRDADMAEEVVSLTTKQILVQSGTAMLAQANMKPNSVLKLLQQL
ncbi:flagellin N-terminal helical domain-containing protein [Leptospira noguchii]|uniref:Flagellin n=2 Tax=Leptospira noguchii TaxID=28182 RepID=M6UAY1_9LEPT|nr:flagellin [Leptospira noguchii]EMO25772.1 flagellar filament core protein FlaB2 [Leptospira interrogans serovar Bataviae str. HAI135]EKR72970.1 flagellar filament core protein flaB2 [Leptospira noguchii str. 2006001870]EMI60971.1 flagellar filament core protein FlaB2 [Leptospira noguchii str. Bonito]EMO41680.1 flagellar filament core protein flaB2 [Leptospira noguchii serovar Autumnalis str. ZUN142]EMS83694.1 flagellar filament core protein FlaB2 [Leptospira noguchii str. Cascata]